MPTSIPRYPPPSEPVWQIILLAGILGRVPEKLLQVLPPLVLIYTLAPDVKLEKVQ